MNVSSDSVEKVRELARRFVKNSPSLCSKHMPEGLPIEAPERKDISENHPAYKFEVIVDNELKKSEADNNDFNRSMVRAKLRSEFIDIYKNKDPRSCIKCYENRCESNNNSIPIRMDVPEKFEFGR